DSLEPVCLEEIPVTGDFFVCRRESSSGVLFPERRPINSLEQHASSWSSIPFAAVGRLRLSVLFFAS
ncbi:hypothetical protein CSUI_007206, partial [Cystoisospora suis]